MEGLAERKARRNRKDEIVAAAEALIRERGLSGTTTRAIAERVPCSEGAIYVHFTSRVEVLLAVLAQSLPAMLIPLHALADKVGKNSVEGNLRSAMAGLFHFDEQSIPMLAGLFSEPVLLDRFRSAMMAGPKGPKGAVKRIASYIAAEQQLGRLKPSIDPETIASVLVASAFFRCFAELLTGQTLPTLKEASLVRQLLRND